jgi:hypothetical protein
LKIGDTTITAIQEATVNYTAGSTDAQLSVNEKSPTINTWIIPPKTFGDAPFTLTNPGSNSTGTFTYTSSDTSVASIFGNTVTILKVGFTTITANQAANGNFASGSTIAQLTVSQKSPTMNTWIIPPKIFGDASFILTPPTSDSSGVFRYTSSDTSVASISGISSNIVTILKVGFTNITAIQEATVNYTARSTTETLTVTKKAPTINTWTIPPKTVGDASFTLTPPTSDSSGAFRYTSSDTSVASISGNTVTILKIGTTTITAIQEETTNYSSGSIDASLNIQKNAPIIGILTIPQKTFGDASFTLTNPSSNSTGSFRYTSSDTSVATTSGNTVTILKVGDTTITAIQAETTIYASGSRTAPLTVIQKVPVIGSLLIPTKTYGDAPFTFTNPTSESEGSFAYASSDTSVATISGNTITIFDAGTTIITITQDAYGNYTDGSSNPTFTVNPIIPTITFSLPETTFGDASFVIPQPSSNSAGTFRYNSSNTSVAEIIGNRIIITGAGRSDITVRQDACGNYADGSSNLIFTVNSRIPNITFSLPQITFGDASFVIPNPSSNSAGTFRYNSSNTAVATINDKTIIVTGGGTTIITVTQDACGNYADGSNTTPFSVTGAIPNIPNFTIPPKTILDGSFTITEPSSNSAGTFRYNSSNTAVATINGKAITIVGLGTTIVTVRQDACGNYIDGSNTTPFTVTKVTTSITNFNIDSSAFVNTDFSFTIIDPSSNSDGSFIYSSSNENVAVISNKKIIAKQAGITTITARQAETTNYSDGSSSIIFTVKNIAPSFGVFTVPTKTYGDASFAITDPSSNSTGTFRYTSSNPNVATISGKIITITGGGTTIITAIQAVSSDYSQGITTAEFNVSRKSPFFTSFIIPTKLYNPVPFAITDPTSDSSGVFRYESLNSNVATINGRIITITGVGTATIIARQQASTNHKDSSINTVFTVNKSLPSFGIFAVPAKPYGDASFTITDPSSNSSGAFSYTSSNNQVAIIKGKTITIIGPGTAIITAMQQETPYYTYGVSSATFTVTDATQVDMSYVSNEIVDSSQCAVLQQLRRRRASTDMPLRFDNLAASPYPTYTQYELDMRRKAEILQYSANNKNTMQNNPTRAQLYSQMVNGYYQPTNQTSSCPENTIPKPTYNSDVPGPVQYLYLNPEIPIYNLNLVREYTDMYYSNNDKWGYTSYTNIVSNSSSDVLIGSLTIKNGIDDTAYSFSLRIPINIYVAGTNNTDLDNTFDFTRKTSNITISNVSCNVYYNNTLLNSTTVTRQVNPTTDSSDIRTINLDTQNSGTKQFQANVFSGYITFNNINLYTANGYTYDFKIDISTLLDTSDPNYTQSDYYSNFQNYVVINSTNTNIISNCDAISDNLYTTKMVTLTGRNSKQAAYSSSVVLL